MGLARFQVKFREPFDRQACVAALGGNAARTDELEQSVYLLQNCAGTSGRHLLLGQALLALVSDGRPSPPAPPVKVVEREHTFSLPSFTSFRNGIGDYHVIAAAFLPVTEQIPLDSFQVGKTRINQPIVVSPPDILHQLRRRQIGYGANQGVPGMRMFSQEPAPK